MELNGRGGFMPAKRMNRQQTFSKRELDVLRLCEQFTDGWPCSLRVPWQSNLEKVILQRLNLNTNVVIIEEEISFSLNGINVKCS